MTNGQTDRQTEPITISSRLFSFKKRGDNNVEAHERAELQKIQSQQTNNVIEESSRGKHNERAHD